MKLAVSHEIGHDGASPDGSNGLAGRPLHDWRSLDADEVYRRVYSETLPGTVGAVAVCSAITGEGKTTVGTGLAATIAQDFPERRVAVVEMDVRRPTLARSQGLARGPGLAEWLLSAGHGPKPYLPGPLTNLNLVPAGEPVSNPSRLLRSNLMRDGIRAIRQDHDLVILDIPALLDSSDSLRLLDLVDRVLFVVRADVTPLPLVERALRQVDERKLCGVVLNGQQSAIPGWLRRLFGL